MEDLLDQMRQKIIRLEKRVSKRNKKRVKSLLNDLNSIKLLHKPEPETETKQSTLMPEAEIKKIGVEFVDKLTLCRSIIEYFDPLLATIMKNASCCIAGSFNRQLIELPFALANGFDKISENGIGGFGNPVGHDVDIVIFDKMSTKQKSRAYKRITECMMHLKNSGIHFGCYELTDIVDSTIDEVNISEYDAIGKRNMSNIPHYVLKFTKKTEKMNCIIVDILGWRPTNEDNTISADFNVNSLLMSRKGLYCKNHNFFDIITDISKRQATSTTNFMRLCESLKNDSFMERLRGLKQINNFVSNRLKILNCGYKTISTYDYDTPEICTEEHDDCYITGSPPPYLTVTLECGHKMSKDALAYLSQLKIVKDFSFKCPLCRSPLNFKLVKGVKRPNKGHLNKRNNKQINKCSFGHETIRKAKNYNCSYNYDNDVHDDVTNVYDDVTNALDDLLDELYNGIRDK
jgi:hypothetical protein